MHCTVQHEAALPRAAINAQMRTGKVKCSVAFDAKTNPMLSVVTVCFINEEPHLHITSLSPIKLDSLPSGVEKSGFYLTDDCSLPPRT